MSALDHAHASLAKAVGELEAATEEAPAYSVTSLRFLRAELRDIVRRVEAVRKVIGDGVEGDAEDVADTP